MKDDIKFKDESGYFIPYRYDIDKDGKIVKKWEPKDGSEYEESIEKMTENNKELTTKMLSPSKEYNYYQEKIDNLKQVAIKRGLKDFSFELDKIPGYNKDVVDIREDVPEGSVCLIKKKDYDDLQEERKKIVPDTEKGVHWVSRNGILWNEKTGICTSYILDYSN